jgi:hypothetical protein
MALAVCAGFELKSLESLLGTAVGVGFIFPVVYQLLSERAKKLLSSSRALVEELESQGDRASMRDLASMMIVFQSSSNKMDRAAQLFILISSLSALTAFSTLILSAFVRLCLGKAELILIIAVVSLPILFCAAVFIWWWDSSRSLINRCEHYYDQ